MLGAPAQLGRPLNLTTGRDRQALGQDRSIVTAGVLELALGQAASTRQIGTAQVCLVQHGAAKLGALQIRVGEVDAPLVGLFELGPCDVGVMQIGAIQIDPIEIGATQTCAAQVGAFEIG